ncbi:hypothetical protein GF362_03420 [Candidatus Dojkabacteria bacterium]|nr:hypothetical protein [Candidatus Dojkabacteria bacterium]
MNKNKVVAIMQSNYVPWKGYFDMINMVDEFILFDSVQYVKRTWRNRNRIKTPNGLQWLTIPVKVKGRYKQSINEVVVSNNHWRKKHWRALEFNYQKAEFFKKYEDKIKRLYLDDNEENLSQINFEYIKEINDILGINTKVVFSRDYNYEHQEGDVECIIELLKKAGAKVFLNGPTAKEYMSKDMFSEHGIELRWMNYGGYPEYRQLFPPFEHSVTILDLIFNHGARSTKYMKSF